VAIRRRDRGEHQRATRGAPHKRRHLAEVVGYQVAGVLVEGFAVGRREEPRDVAEAGEVPVHVAPLAVREHLVDADPR
jgi:hypothetical protein